MAVKGAQAKLDITEKILKTFPGAFVYEKEIRIPYIDVDNTVGQIKLTLTAAKTMIENDNEPILPGEKTETKNIKLNTTNETIPQEPTQEEKERLTMLLNKLGL